MTREGEISFGKDYICGKDGYCLPCLRGGIGRKLVLSLGRGKLLE